MDLNTSQSTRLTSGEADDTQPSVSRDGRRLLFLRNQRELYVMPAAGGRPSLLHAFEGPSRFVDGLVWGPDGSTVILSMATKTGDLFVLQPEVGDSR